MQMISLKSSVRHAAALANYTSGAYLARLRGRVLILAYHRVLPEGQTRGRYVQPGMYVSADVFEMHLRFLKKHCRVLSLGDLLTLWSTGGWDPSQRYCAITFDDGWLDNWSVAFPILKKCEVPATIFLTTGLIGTARWFWPERIAYLLQRWYMTRAGERRAQEMPGCLARLGWFRRLLAVPGDASINTAIERLKDLREEDIQTCIDWLRNELALELPNERMLLNWDEVRQMSRHGMAFGSHSVTHRILTKLGPDEVMQELVRSRETLSGQGANTVPVFCYPNGNYNARIASQVKAAGYEAALTTRYGHESTAVTNPFALKRICLHNDITKTLPLLTFHICGFNRG